MLREKAKGGLMGARQAVCGGNMLRMALALNLTNDTTDNGKWEDMGDRTGVVNNGRGWFWV